MAEIKKIKPSLPKGTRDFLPEEVAKRNYIFDTIKTVFRKYGFQQIDTPAFERLETLTGKYGEEGDRLLFKILNSGDYLKDAPDAELQSKNSGAVTKHIAEKGLRYDLTVPLARYVVQHNGELTFPFRRFHIGPVWRADRPQKGRYQEFYQCDADVIGSTSLLNEVELTQIYVEVFDKLGISTNIFYSSRKFLYGIAQYCFAESHFEEFVAILDKSDKIGHLEVESLLRNHPIFGQNNTADRHLYLISEDSQQLLRSMDERMNFYADCFMKVNSTIGLQGLEEMKFLYKNYNLIKQKGGSQGLLFTLELTRGLDYYSGIIWEVKVNRGIENQRDITIGSIGGGGRYDNLTEMFGGRDMSGVGISFGIERIYDVMEELGLFQKLMDEGRLNIGADVLVYPYYSKDENEFKANEDYAFAMVRDLREADISAELFMGNLKKEKQFDYAGVKRISYLLEVGKNEREKKEFKLKNTRNRESDTLTIEQIIKKLNPSNSRDLEH